MKSTYLPGMAVVINDSEGKAIPATVIKSFDEEAYTFTIETKHGDIVEKKPGEFVLALDAGSKRSMKSTLSEVQLNVVRWVGKGFNAYLSHGSTIAVNGEHVCNLKTIKVLAQKGLVEVDPDNENTWKRTPGGAVLAEEIT